MAIDGLEPPGLCSHHNGNHPIMMKYQVGVNIFSGRVSAIWWGKPESREVLNSIAKAMTPRNIDGACMVSASTNNNQSPFASLAN